MILFALAALGATVVAFVLYPVFSESRQGGFSGTGDVEREVLSLEEKKARLYEAITDLDFEKDAGKVSEQDYQTARTDYMTQVAAILTRLDEIAPAKPAKAETPAAGKADRDRDGSKKERAGDEGSGATRVCASCGKPSRATGKFCMHCGAPFGIACAGCGAVLPQEARFCMSCGQKVAS